MRIQYRWYSRSRRPCTGFTTQHREHLRGNQFGAKGCIAWCTAASNVTVMEGYVLERRGRWRSDMTHAQWNWRGHDDTAGTCLRGGWASQRRWSLPRGVGQTFFIFIFIFSWGGGYESRGCIWRTGKWVGLGYVLWNFQRINKNDALKSHRKIWTNF